MGLGAEREEYGREATRRTAASLENRWLKSAVQTETAMHRALMPIALLAQQAKLFAFRRLQRNAATRRVLECRRALPVPRSPRSSVQRRFISARRITSVLKKALLTRFGI